VLIILDLDSPIELPDSIRQFAALDEFADFPQPTQLCIKTPR
jgi:hypothetical protein